MKRMLVQQLFGNGRSVGSYKHDVACSRGELPTEAVEKFFAVALASAPSAASA
jgi:hypothetical protein